MVLPTPPLILVTAMIFISRRKDALSAGGCASGSRARSAGPGNRERIRAWEVLLLHAVPEAGFVAIEMGLQRRDRSHSMAHGLMGDPGTSARQTSADGNQTPHLGGRYAVR